MSRQSPAVPPSPGPMLSAPPPLPSRSGAAAPLPERAPSRAAADDDSGAISSTTAQLLEATASEGVAGLPSGWEVGIDPDNGDQYFINVVTGGTTWERPTTAATAAASAPSARPLEYVGKPGAAAAAATNPADPAVAKLQGAAAEHAKHSAWQDFVERHPEIHGMHVMEQHALAYLTPCSARNPTTMPGRDAR
jgi:hypothetical protein